MAATDTTNDVEKTEAEKILESKLGPPVAGEAPAADHEADIEQPVMHKDWKFRAEYKGLNDEVEVFERSYIQKPLSYHAFAEFTGLLGRKLAEAMQGPDGLSLDRVSIGSASIPLEYTDGQIRLSSGDEGLVDPIVQGIAKLATYVPDILAEAQCIWLRVPRNERAFLVEIWARPVDEGGMSMDEGEEMMKIFIEQNYDEMNNFLKRYVRVANTVTKMRERNKKDE